MNRRAFLSLLLAMLPAVALPAVVSRQPKITFRASENYDHWISYAYLDGYEYAARYDRRPTLDERNFFRKVAVLAFQRAGVL